MLVRLNREDERERLQDLGAVPLLISLDLGVRLLAGLLAAPPERTAGELRKPIFGLLSYCASSLIFFLVFVLALDLNLRFLLTFASLDITGATFISNVLIFAVFHYLNLFSVPHLSTYRHTRVHNQNFGLLLIL